MACIFLFCYFGFIIIPDGSRPLSIPFFVWILLLPIVVIALIVIGYRGGMGLRLAGLGILWLIISIVLAIITHYAYSHKKFDATTWKDASWEDAEFLQFSARERMVDDLISNVLPGLTRAEIIGLLGEPDGHIDFEGEEYLSYYLGQGITDPECLHIDFDERGRLKYYYVSLCGIF